MISSPFSHTLSPLPNHHLNFRRVSPPSTTVRYASAATVKMSSVATIEHVVLLKVKENTDPSKVTTMVNDLNALGSLSQVLYMTTGPVHKIRPESAYTHMLHGRIKSKWDLLTYLLSPQHVLAVINSVLPICETVMIVDYTRPTRPENPTSGSVVRATLVKLKDGTGEEKNKEVMRVLSKEVSKHVEVDNSVGENFMPYVNKGYAVGSVEVFSGLNKMEEPSMETVKLKDSADVDDVLIIDYVIP